MTKDPKDPHVGEPLFREQQRPENPANRRIENDRILAENQVNE